MKAHPTHRNVRLHPARTRRSAGGFTMIEVLVSLTVACFGLLGVAGLFLKGMEASATSMIRSTAVQQAYDMADRMRANPTALAAGEYKAVPVSNSASCSCSGSACTPAALAAYDACVWNQQNARLLPSGGGTVTQVGSLYNILVQWDDDKSGSASKNFTLQVQP